MTQTSRIGLALVVSLSIGCGSKPIDVGDIVPVPDGGVDSAGGTAGTDAPGTTGGAGGSGGSSGWTDVSVLQSVERAIDILFVVDNSPSMDPKQAALSQSFPKMMKVLQDLEGGMPDVHIGVVSSDMGAGGGEAGGNCAVVLGNQGILWGNDPTQNPDDLNNKYATLKNINNGCGLNAGARWIEDIRNGDDLTRYRNYTGDLANVFSCMAKGVGVNGCGYEHTLQSLRVALNPADRINAQNFNFLRPKAYLGIVIVSDEDDCSAAPSTDTNDGMFFPRTLGDTASLRCAARGHVCNGQPIPNYDPMSGYTAKTPFVANLANCEAKDDTGTSRDYQSLPLIRVQEIIDSVKQVKARPAEQILVAGIIGWPENGDLIGATYRIDKDTTAMPVDQQKLWDYMPICTRPDQRSVDGNIYRAYPGLRLKKFIEGFGENGQYYSICNTDGIPNALEQIGNAVAQRVGPRVRPACVMSPLVDKDLSLPEIQPECNVFDKTACDTPGQGTCLISGYVGQILPECIDPSTGNPLSPSSPARSNISNDARPCWYLAYDTDPISGCSNAPLGQKISVLRKGDGVAPAGAILEVSCRTCTSASDPGCASH